MTPIFKCLICRKDIERSTKTFWSKKGHLLCSTCLDNIEENSSKRSWDFNWKGNDGWGWVLQYFIGVHSYS